jgi:hypothetical protein
VSICCITSTELDKESGLQDSDYFIPTNDTSSFTLASPAKGKGHFVSSLKMKQNAIKADQLSY